ncbi:leucine/isoleucine/valine transporter ATP-binding subunit [Escherichia coli]|uniref:Leucine/isoleucine/valine transporter ATP-binding subunit n=1 Tax=Escherichia coli TaxID=562 RepID=A0A2X1JS50_ECOLX|nr:leucine/isoleucine/valine transporter ATP-binding subunit [Escherichia coli]
MEKVMLSFDKVSAHYGKIQALHEVSLHINQGEIVTLIGANGGGENHLAWYVMRRSARHQRANCV